MTQRELIDEIYNIVIVSVKFAGTDKKIIRKVVSERYANLPIENLIEVKKKFAIIIEEENRIFDKGKFIRSEIAKRENREKKKISGKLDKLLSELSRY